MARALSAARVRVAPEHEQEFFRVLCELAGYERAAGRRLWLFRNTDDPRWFIEFSESPDVSQHRSVVKRSAVELKLEERLRQLANYSPDANVMWREVPICPADSSS